jgi:hypothetical protein
MQPFLEGKNEKVHFHRSCGGHDVSACWPAAADSTSSGAVATGAASGASASAASGNASKIKIGVILVGDETEGYTKAHMDGIDAARRVARALPRDQVIYMKSIPESSECYDTADQAHQGRRLLRDLRQQLRPSELHGPGSQGKSGCHLRFHDR